MSRALVAALLAASLFACGKYGPPVRATAQKPPEKKSFEIPLPGATEPGPGSGAPAPSAEPTAPPPPGPAEVEEEPPPEGAP